MPVRMSPTLRSYSPSIAGLFDIGANTGQYTQLAARLVGKRGRVFAFEPVPNTAEVLDVQVKASSINKLYEYSEL